MNPVKAFVNPSGRTRCYDFYQLDEYGHRVTITLSQVARLGRVKKGTIHQYLATLHGHVEFDITSQLLRWQSQLRMKQQRARKARLGIKPMSPAERTRLSVESRKRREQYRRDHIVAMRAVGAAPDPFADDAQLSADQTRSQRDPVFDDGHNGVP